jgi:hypothetical protein
MKKNRQFFIWIAGAFLILFSIVSKAQNPTYSCYIANAAQVSCNVYEFDVIAKRTGTTVFKLAQFQCGIHIPVGIIPAGGIINVAPVPNSSNAITNASQRPTPDRFTYDSALNCIRITPKSPPGIGTASVISNQIAGTKLCRVRVSCSLPFVVGTSPIPTWSFSVATGYPTKFFAYVPSNVDITVQASHTVQANGGSNVVFTAAGFTAPIPQTVTSDMTQVCQVPGVGATISLSDTQDSNTYYLYVNGVAVPGAAGVLFGTGAVASFGHLVTDGGVVSVMSPSCGGPISMLNTITLTTLTPVNASVVIAASPGTSVVAGTPVTFTATPVNGGSTPIYVWYVNATQDTTTGPIFHYTPVNGDVIHCEMISSETCVTPSTAASNALSIYVLANSYNITLSGSVLTHHSSYCQGTGGLPIGLDSSDIGVTYTLYKNGVSQVPTVAGTGFPITFGNQLAGIYTITGSNTAGAVPMNGSDTITETPAVPVSVSIVVDQNNLCSVVPVTYTATPVNGGTTPVYEWHLGANIVGSNQATYTNPTPANGDVVYVKLTSNAGCVAGSPATSNNITIAILQPHQASVSIVANQNNVCQGATVNFVATPLFGGTIPIYQWYKNGLPVGSNSTLYSYVPANGDSVCVVMTSNYPCVTGSPDTSNMVHMIINPVWPVSVTAVSNLNNICSGTPVTFTATPTNGGPTPTYYWHVNGVTVYTGPNAFYTFTPTNGNLVNVTMSTSLTQCFTGNPAVSGNTTMIVNPVLPASVSLTASPTIPVSHQICANTPESFTAVPVNGGTTPTYQWFLNGVPTGGTTANYTYPGSAIFGSTDSVKVILTSSLLCVTGGPNTIAKTWVIINNCVGIEELSDVSSIVVYPNPTNDKLYVNFGDLKETPKNMRVYNTMGQVCFQTDQPLMVNQSGIDVAKMSRGTYTLQIMFENDIVTKRFIVE